MSDHPFFDKIPVKFTIPLPPKGRALGIKVMECDYYLLPYISKSKAGFSFYQKLPGDNRNSVLILSIDDVEPHSTENVISLLQGKQQCGKATNIVIYLAKRGSAPHRNRIEENYQILKQV
eukprot:239273-Ditylum_brightwellii.AAC.1